jgi:exonuclease SbcC
MRYLSSYDSPLRITIHSAFNLHPYRLMPSRASSLGVGGFSFYEHLAAPEAVKELSWEHGGKTYRSTLVLRQNGARRSERICTSSLQAGGCRFGLKTEP